MFTDDQLQTVLSIIRGIVDGIINTSNSGMIGRAREMTAFTQYVAQAGSQFANNDFIAQLIPHMTSSVFFASGSPFQKPSDIFDAMGELGAGLPVDEAGVQVRQFIIGLVEAVAGASGGGLFGRGDKLSDDETTYLDILRAKLGM
jgi:hypothetical protein